MSEEVDYKLYGEFGDRYDQHTPAHHYQHDHEFVLSRARAHGKCCRLLDLGCGTGIFLEKALAEGFNPFGLDCAPQMIKLAQQRVGERRALLGEMQAFDFKEPFDCIVSLSWSINYCEDREQLQDLLRRCFCALSPGGELILQVAHAPNAETTESDFFVDKEFGPAGAKDIVLSYRFWAEDQVTMMAEYHFECVSTRESFRETHRLQIANAQSLTTLLLAVGFERIELLDDWRGRELNSSISPFILALRPME